MSSAIKNITILSSVMIAIVLLSSCGFKTDPIFTENAITFENKKLTGYYVEDTFLVNLPKNNQAAKLEIAKLVLPEPECVKDCFLKSIPLAVLMIKESVNKTNYLISDNDKIIFDDKYNTIKLLDFNPEQVFNIVLDMKNSRNNVIDHFSLFLPPKPIFKSPVFTKVEKLYVKNDNGENTKFFLNINWQKPLRLSAKKNVFQKDITIDEYRVDIVIIEKLADNIFFRTNADAGSVTFETYEEVENKNFCAFFIDNYQNRSSCTDTVPEN